MLILSCLFLSIGLIYSQNITVSGVVVDDAGIEVVGASVVVKGTTTGVGTDIDGKFSLSAPSNSTLVFSLVGMKKKEMKAAPSMKVVMENDEAMLEEVIVTGYGAVKKSSFTGSASVLSTEKLENVPSTSLTSRLSGAAAGVQITSSSGQPGAMESMRIRGTGSINASNEPLYVIDGVPMQNDNMTEFTYSNSGSSALATLNANDIATITVIKDAAAASLYGSRAANGVIVITTKQGAGKTKVNLRSDWGFSNMAINYRPTLNGDDRRELLHMGLVNYAKKDPTIGDPLAYADKQINTYAEKPWSGWEDWRDRILKTGKVQNYEVSIQGGTDKTTYYTSLAYSKTEGIVANSKLDKVTGRINLGHQATNKLHIAVNATFTNTKQDVRNEGTSYSSGMAAISSFASPQDYAYNEDGTLNLTNKFLGMGGNRALSNPLNVIQNDYDKLETNRFLGAVTAKYDIYEGLYATETLSYDFTQNNSKVWWDPAGPNGKASGGVYQRVMGNRDNFISQSRLGYVKTFGTVHNFDALVSYEVEKYKYDNIYANGVDYLNPQKHEIENANVNAAESHYEDSRMISYLALANYNYDNRYYFSTNFRRDGSSRFARDRRWGDFWSVSGSWRLTEESFMASMKEVLTDAKLRLSYGVNGTLPTNFYDYMDVFKFGNKYNGINGAAEARLAYTDLTWEKNKSFNIGIDLYFLDRFNVIFDFYNRNTSDLLIAKSNSLTTGFSSTMMNLGAMNNRGVELTIGSKNITTSDFSWDTQLNLFHNRNRVRRLDGVNDEMSITSSILRHYIGKDFNTFYVFESAGVDPETGKELFYKNTEGSGRETTSVIAEAEKIPYKNTTPTVQGGITNNFRYKDFDLGFTFTYSLGGHLYDNIERAYFGGAGSTNQYNGAVSDIFQMKDIWQKPGDNAKIPEYVYGSTAQISSRFIHSTDHLRLKNVTLGYAVPTKVLKDTFISKVRLYAAASNLFTLKSKDLKVDPEIPVDMEYGARTYGIVGLESPPLRSVTFGVEVTF